MDVPPMRWFKEPLVAGRFYGSVLNLEKYHGMLNAYYAKRGWDDRGVPKKSTLQKLGLQAEAQQLSMHVKLEE